MKKILSLLLVCTVLGFVACDDDDDPKPAAPTVSVTPSSAQDIPGATVSATVTVTAPGGAKTLTLSGGVSETIPLNGSKTAITQPFEVDIPANAVVGSSIAVVLTAQDNENQSSAPVTFTVTVGNPVLELSGSIAANQTLDASKEYLLKGQVFVESGITLTIPAGTVLKGDKATKATLVVKPGGLLVCNGTAASPVVFTSAQNVGERDRGDWGGVIILGNAFVNQAARPAIEGISPAVNYGSVAADGATPETNASENSGSLTYVRIEYAGIELTPNNETNSLTMGGVGNGTTIENVQVSFGGDDGFEWFGGTVNGKYLISFGTWDDDMDTDFGWGGNVQFALIVRYPFYADQSGSNAFETDNQANGNEIDNCDGTNNSGCTRGIFSNVSVFGPREFNNPSRSISANYQNAMHIRRRSALSIFNSYFSGFRVGLRIDDSGTLANLNGGTSKLANNILAVPGTTVTGTSTTAADASFATGLNINDAGAGNATAIKTYWDNNNNETLNPTAATGEGSWSADSNPYGDLGLSTAMFWGGNAIGTYPANPDFAVTTGDLAEGADFTDAKLAGNSFFEAVNYRGAFGATDWTDGWAEFQPLTKGYE